MDPQTMKAISVQGHHVLPTRRAVIHRDNKILHPVSRDVADDYLVDPADVAQHCTDLKRPISVHLDECGNKGKKKIKRSTYSSHHRVGREWVGIRFFFFFQLYEKPTNL